MGGDLKNDFVGDLHRRCSSLVVHEMRDRGSKGEYVGWISIVSVDAR